MSSAAALPGTWEHVRGSESSSCCLRTELLRSLCTISLQILFGTKGLNFSSRESAALSPESSSSGVCVRRAPATCSRGTSGHTELSSEPHLLFLRLAHWSGGLRGNTLAGPKPGVFSMRKSSQVPDQSPFLGGSHPFVSGCPQLSIIRPSSWGALDPKKQCSGNPWATVIARWRRAGEEAASTPEFGHIRKQHLSQCFSSLLPHGGLSLTGALWLRGGAGMVRSHSCLPQLHSSPWSPRVSQFPPNSRCCTDHLGFATVGVERCGLGT